MSELEDYVHPRAKEDDMNYFGEDVHDYVGRKILVLLRENRKKEIEILVPGFIEKYKYKTDKMKRQISRIEPVPSARRKEIEYFLRGDGGNYGVDEGMVFLNNEVEPKGYSHVAHRVSGGVPTATP